MVIRRGESIEFDVAYHGLDNTYIDLSFGSSGAQSYTISNSVSETGEPLNILFAHEEEYSSLSGFGSAGEAEFWITEIFKFSICLDQLGTIRQLRIGILT